MRWTVVAVICIMQLLYNGNVSSVHNASNNISRIDFCDDIAIHKGKALELNYSGTESDLLLEPIGIDEQKRASKCDA